MNAVKHILMTVCTQSDREGLYQRPCSNVRAEANHPLTGTRRR